MTGKSIHNLKPLNKGGQIAEGGFVFQHHIGVHFLLKMFKEPELKMVYLETHDDITLIWQNGDKEEVEFVQVKSNLLDQLCSYTSAGLC